VSISAQIILQVHVVVDPGTLSVEVNALVLLLLFCTLLFYGLLASSAQRTLSIGLVPVFKSRTEICRNKQDY